MNLKKTVSLGLALGFVAISVYAQTADRALSAVIREAESFVNGCGPEDWPRFSAKLNSLSGSFTRAACNQHDLDYGTLGMSRSEADDNLFRALGLGAWWEAPGVASTFWAAVRTFGGSAYESAQRRSREEFRRIHHGNEWHPSLGRWHPSHGHVRMSLPGCVPSCTDLARW